MRVAAAQPHVIAGDVAATALSHADAVRAAGARVVVFPEMSLTGYDLTAPALDPADPRLDPLVAACAETGTVALVGAPVAGEHIATLVVDDGGARIGYRKLWLGDAEAARFRPGDAPAVLEVDGVRLGLAICKDTGIERHWSDTAALGVDVYVAGVVEHDHEVAVPEQRALRIAAVHGVAVVMASFAGPTGSGYDRTAGCSGIWSATGERLARAGAEPGEVVSAELSSPSGPGS